MTLLLITAVFGLAFCSALILLAAVAATRVKEQTSVNEGGKIDGCEERRSASGQTIQAA